jgi:hypothetical protein
MTTRKPTKDLSALFQFVPQVHGDPVPWPFFTQFDRATQVKVAQAQLDLHRQTLQAQLDATTRISAAIKGK